MTESIGTSIGGYEIEAVLGRGGMGVVYRASDRRLGRKVALKVLPAEYSDDGTFRARFLRESRLAASIDHPNVIPIYEAGADGRQLFIAMRHVEGTDLAQVLRQHGPLAPDRAMVLIAQLAAGLDAAHGQGLVHRDIKPSNALVTGEGDHVYLSDFGLSRELTADATLSSAGGFVGTVRYMAPEVIRSGHADARSDIYSLGCVLFECLTGEVPYPGATDAAVIYGHLEHAPPRASDRNQALPRAIDGVLARALDKDPARRHASGAALVEATRGALAGMGPAGTRRRRVIIAALAAGALGCAGLVAAVLDPSPSPELAAVEGDGVAIIDAEAASLEAEVALDGAPGAMARTAGAVWIADRNRGVVSRVDPASRSIRQTIRVGSQPSAIAADADSVWVANAADGSVSVISPETNEVVDRIRVGHSVDGLCLAGGAAWVASPSDHSVVRIDPETGRTGPRIRLDGEPARLTCRGDDIWVSSPVAGTMTEVSASAQAALSTIQVGRGAVGVAIGPSGVWVTNPAGGTVSRIDPARRTVTATVALAATDRPREVLVTRDAVWVTSEERGMVLRIDPERAEVVERLRVGSRPQNLAVVGGRIWVAVADAGRRHRGGTLRVEYAVRMSWRYLDPASAPGAESAEVLGVMHDSLIAFRRTGGIEGTALVANLAETLPSPSADGRSYAFRLRRGLRYSNGEPVRASDIRFSFERSMALGGVVMPILGAGACRPRRCDLSRGVVTDDAARTVVLRLSEPDADLLHKLPVLAVLPASVGLKVPAGRPLPTTGPYVVESFASGRLRLVRNPHFRPFPPARPEAYADAIEIRTGVDGEGAVKRVLDGRADRINTFGTLPPDRLPMLRRRAAGRLRATVAPTTYMFTLNTRRPPFDRLEARRAVAYAFDRREAVKAAGGREIAQETCQFLPPSYLGSRPYCPFTVPGSGGPAGRPDLERARALVRRSGTAGARVTVQQPEDAPPGLADTMAAALRRLGYRAGVRTRSVDEHFGALLDPQSRVQVGFLPWTAAYPAPRDFLGLFSCAALEGQNPSRFCDRHIERLMTAAGRLQAADPAESDEQWAAVERRIVDQVPAVAAYNLVVTDVVSERLGNYHYNPLHGMLLDQAWVR